MAFGQKVKIVVPKGLNIDGIKSLFRFILIPILNLEINYKLLNLSLIVQQIYVYSDNARRKWLFL